MSEVRVICQPATLLAAEPATEQTTGKRSVILWLDLEGSTYRVALPCRDASMLATQIDEALVIHQAEEDASNGG